MFENYPKLVEIKRKLKTFLVAFILMVNYTISYYYLLQPIIFRDVERYIRVLNVL